MRVFPASAAVRGLTTPSSRIPRHFRRFFGFEDLSEAAADGGGRRRAQRGADLRYDMSLAFEEASAGVTTKIKLPSQNTARHATARAPRRAQAFRPAKRAPAAGSWPSAGILYHYTHVPGVPGRGSDCEGALPGVRGKDASSARRPLAADPAGAWIQERGCVSPGRRARAERRAGGRFVRVLEVKEHPFFERRGADLVLHHPPEHRTGDSRTELQVPGLNGEEKLKIPKARRSGAVFRIKGKGWRIPAAAARAICTITCVWMTPTKLTRDQRKLIEQLGATMKVENSPRIEIPRSSNKVKDIFG